MYVRSATGALEFRRAAEPTQEQLEALVRFSAQRIRALTGHTAPEDLPVVEAPVLRLVGLEPDADPPAPASKRLTAEHDGFNLHAATTFHAEDRAALERFIRYCARGPIALGRLSLRPNGNVSYQLKNPRADGTTHMVFTPHAFLTRLSWLIAQPHIHLLRYHGVFAPHHAWRSEIVLHQTAPEEESSDGAARPTGPAKGLSWAELLRRVFAVEVLVCTACGGERRIIAEVEEGPVARKILAHLGLPTSAPKPRQGSLFSTGPPPVDEPEATVHWSDDGPLHCVMIRDLAQQETEALRPDLSDKQFFAVVQPQRAQRHRRAAEVPGLEPAALPGHPREVERLAGGSRGRAVAAGRVRASEISVRAGRARGARPHSMRRVRRSRDMRASVWFFSGRGRCHNRLRLLRRLVHARLGATRSIQTVRELGQEPQILHETATLELPAMESHY